MIFYIVAIVLWLSVMVYLNPDQSGFLDVAGMFFVLLFSCFNWTGAIRGYVRSAKCWTITVLAVGAMVCGAAIWFIPLIVQGVACLFSLRDIRLKKYSYSFIAANITVVTVMMYFALILCYAIEGILNKM